MVDDAISANPVKWQHRGNRWNSEGTFNVGNYSCYKLGIRRGHTHHA